MLHNKRHMTLSPYEVVKEDSLMSLVNVLIFGKIFFHKKNIVSSIIIGSTGVFTRIVSKCVE